MAFLEYHGKSSELGMNIAFRALVPQVELEKENQEDIRKLNQSNGYKVIYLLHGYSDNSTSWMRMTAIERFLCKEPVVVIMPETDNYCWVNTYNGFKFGDYLTKELPRLVTSLFPVSTKPEDTMIAGFSMGGYGALHAGLTNPTRYGLVAAFAPAILVENRYQGKRPVDFESIFGDRNKAKDSDFNLYQLLKAEKSPEIYLTTGKNDFLYEEDAQFFQEAKKQGLPIEFEPVEGKHDWFFAEEAFYRAYARFMRK